MKCSHVREKCVKGSVATEHNRYIYGGEGKADSI